MPARERKACVTPRGRAASGSGGPHWSCAYCGPVKREDLSLDHLDNVRPLNNKPENLVTACFSCNSARSDTELEAYVGAASARKIRAQARLPLDRATARNYVKLERDLARNGLAAEE
jgi:5-methylcytosine-specific restriction endonuclease McrA